MTQSTNDQTLLEQFKNEMNATAGDETSVGSGIQTFTLFNSWDVSQGAIIQSVYRTHRKYIHGNETNDEVKQMARWLFLETSADKDFLAKAEKNFTSKDVLKHMAIYAFSAPVVRKTKSQHDKLKNTFTVLNKLHADETIDVKTDIVGKYFHKGVEAYRLGNNNSGNDGSDRESNLNKAKAKAATTPSVKVTQAEWSKLVVDAEEVKTANNGSYMSAVGKVDDFGNFTIFGLVPSVYPHIDGKASNISDSVMLKWLEQQNKSAKKTLDMAASEIDAETLAQLIQQAKATA